MIPDQVGYFSEEDTLLLMHCDVHFSQNFELMADYYASDGIGVDPDIDLKRIQEFQKLSRKEALYLFENLITPEKLPRVLEAKEAYLRLRDVYESESKDVGACLLSDLLLSEDEDTSDEEQAIFEYGTKLIPVLVTILRSYLYHSSLGPGYGQGPSRVLRCLSLFDTTPCISEAFESLSISDNPFYSYDVTNYFRIFENQAKAFLFKQIESAVLSEDHRRALEILAEFELTEEDRERIIAVWAQHLSNPQSAMMAHCFSSLLLEGLNEKLIKKLKKIESLNPAQRHLEELKYLISRDIHPF